MTEVWGTIVVAVISLIGTFAGSYSGMKLMSYRIDKLEEKVNKHNSVIERTFVLEEKMNVANHRISDLERHEEELRAATGRR